MPVPFPKLHFQLLIPEDGEVNNNGFFTHNVSPDTVNGAAAGFAKMFAIVLGIVSGLQPPAIVAVCLTTLLVAAV